MTTDGTNMWMISPSEERDWLDGLRYCHYQLNANARKVFEALAYSYSLVEVLIAKGVVGIEELNQRKDAVSHRLAEDFQKEQIGVRIDEQTGDKYSLGDQEMTVDCQARWPICQGICCRLEFALSVQDIEEGIVRWNLSQPYLDRKGEDGLCVHQDRATHRCTVYEQRPAICHIYSCQEDKRIWLDFERRIMNPAMFQSEATAPVEQSGGTECSAESA